MTLPLRPLFIVLLALAGMAPIARATVPGPDPPQCDHDLELVINWTGDEWEIASPSAAYPPFEACRGRRVTWALGDTPPGNRDHFLAWVHIAPRFFVPDGVLDASTGFATVTASKAVSIRVRDDAPAEHLEYAVLVLNVMHLNQGFLKQLDEDLRGRRYGQARRFAPLTFVQQGSPPRMIIR